jgi:hypothetical protein
VTDFQLGKYMVTRFVQTEGQTSVYHIVSVNHGTRLGTIKWHFPWRQYVLTFSDELVQQPDEELLFNVTCLEEITKFLRTLNLLHKEELRTTKLGDTA